MARPRTPLLSRERIRDAALALIDRDGLAELSMRKLAQELGVRAASLYSRASSKRSSRARARAIPNRVRPARKKSPSRSA